ncbi:MAG: HD-GYP domain-containing protein [Clostridiales bacterium]|nr:HD-GYP domain-containing protein [Clostridiales bacterium]
MKERKFYKRIMIAMCTLFIILVISTTAFGIYIYKFNNTLRHYDSGQENDAFDITIAPRTGQTDSWTKIIEEAGKTVDYKGRIYDVTINNTGECNISEWNLRIDITQDVYINNAWCGKVEIHQNVNGEEVVQTIDLRNYDAADLEIEYSIVDPDLLIPLQAGDYIIYHPDFASDEYPISQGDSEKITQVVFGIIFYDKSVTPIEYNDYHMNYYLQIIYIKNPIFIILCVGNIMWIVCLIVFSAVGMNMKKANVRFRQDDHIIKESIGVFTRFFEAKDTYTNGHSQRVAMYSKMIAQKIGCTEDEIRNIYYIALMHDCGKCYIPDGILKKPGKLDADEYEIIKNHTVKGAEMIENFNSIENIREGVLYHHERYDGGGYPSGLKGEKIPIVARIICIADSFDAMNSRRCYRDVMSKDYIISEIKNNCGKQFDPELVEKFMELIEENRIEFSKMQ